VVEADAMPAEANKNAADKKTAESALCGIEKFFIDLTISFLVHAFSCSCFLSNPERANTC